MLGMSSFLYSTQLSIVNCFKGRRHLWLLFGIISIGILFRLYRLGGLGITENEDYVANAVSGVLATWLPSYPSGALYPRALPLTYLTSLSVYLFGYEDFALRIPSFIFSTLSIVVGYLLTVRLFSVRVALIAASLIAFSDWEILLGRTARMYGMLSFFLLLSMWLLDKAIMEGGRVLKSLTIISVAVTCLVQELAIMLLPFYFFYFLFRRPRGKALRFLFVCVLVTVCTFAANSFIKRHYYSQAFAIEASLLASQKAESADKALTQIDIRSEKKPTNLLNKVLESTPVSLLLEKHLRIFLQAQKYQPVMVLILIVSGIVGFAIYGIKNFRRPDSRIYTAAIALIIFPLCFQQIMLALFVVLVYTLLARAFEVSAYERRSYVLLIFCGVASLLWIFLGIISLEGAPLENFYVSTMMLFSFPMSFFALYSVQYPFLTVCALTSVAVALNRYLASGRVDEIGYISLLFTGTILLIGFHPLSLSRPFPRYVAFLNPYFLIMVAFMIDMAISRLTLLKYKSMSGAKMLVIVAVTLLALALIVRETVYSAWYMVNTDYGENNLPAATAGYVRSFYPDQKTPALFVKKNADQNDIVIVMDSLAFYAYFPRVDFQLRLTGGTDAERWLGRQTLFSEKELVDVLRKYRRHNIWLVLEGKMLKQYGNDREWANILKMIVSQSGLPRYVGHDKLSSVYLIPLQED